MSIQLETLLKESNYLQAMVALGKYILESGERGMSAPHYNQYYLINIERNVRKGIAKIVNQDNIRWQDVELRHVDCMRSTLDFRLGDADDIGSICIVDNSKTHLHYKEYDIEINPDNKLGEMLLNNMRWLIITSLGSPTGESCDYACKIYYDTWHELVNELHKAFKPELGNAPILWMVPTDEGTFLLESGTTYYNVIVKGPVTCLVDADGNTTTCTTPYAIGDHVGGMYDRACFILRSGVNHQYIQNPVLHEVLEDLME